jgi:TolB-like protein/DNA-binding SARP family transcriptional activator/Tfp pilus assembly protein PilF
MRQQVSQDALLRVKLIGSVEAADSSDNVLPLQTRKARALLAYLALNSGQWVTRSRITRLLWDRVPEEQGRASLRQALHELSRAIGPAFAKVVDTERERLRLKPETVWVDALVVAKNENASLDDHPDLNVFSGSLLLDGLDDFSDEFQNWLVTERQKLEERIRRWNEIRIQNGLKDQHGRQTCVETARRAVAIDPTNENAVRELMLALANSGQRAQAVLEYERCRAVLRARLDLEPAPETQRLYHDLRRPTSVAHQATRPTHPVVAADGVAHSCALIEPSAIGASEGVEDAAKGKADCALGIGDQPLAISQMPLADCRRVSGVALARVPPLPEKPSIAVMPFQNMSGDKEQDYFADGMVEEIITALSRINWLFVIARNSSFTYKGRPICVKQIGQELGVRYVLEGSVRKAANRVRITAQLIDAIAGHHVWAERYDRELADVFAVQDEIADRVMAAIEPQLYAAEGARAKRKPPESMDAWECLVRAISLINIRTKCDGAAARGLLEKATELDPSYARAHSLLAFVLALGVLSGWEPRQPALSLAIEAAQKALSLDNDDPWSHAATGFVMVLDRRVKESIAEYERALALNPSFAYGHTMLAAAYCYLGRSDEAMAHLDQAERLSPRDLLTHGNHGANNVLRAAACMVADRYREGIAFARRALAENPSSTPGSRQLVINCALAGEIEEAKSALQIVKRLQPDISLQWIEEWAPFVRAEDRWKYAEGFRLAGLAEHNGKRRRCVPPRSEGLMTAHDAAQSAKHLSS